MRGCACCRSTRRCARSPALCVFSGRFTLLLTSFSFCFSLFTQLAYGNEPPVEAKDVTLAVRSRAENGFTRVAAREVLAQQAASVNAEPMPILPKRTVVALPTDLSQCVPGARRLLEQGLEVDDDEDLEGCGIESAPMHSWWHDRVARAKAMPEGMLTEAEQVELEGLAGGGPDKKRQKH